MAGARADVTDVWRWDTVRRPGPPAGGLEPGLTSVVCKGGARLKAVSGLRVDAGAAWTLVINKQAGNLHPVEVGQEPIVTSPQPENDSLLYSLECCSDSSLSLW